jgi:two-component system CheB/CheR fusion protein
VIESMSSTRPLEILLVENHPDTMKYLRMYLEEMGHSVRGAFTMEEGLRDLAEHSPDVLLSDIGLPDGTGWELMEKAKVPDTVYAMAMSGFGKGNDQARSRAAGYRHHILKPFTPDILDEFLEEAADKRAEREEEAEAKRMGDARLNS